MDNMQTELIKHRHTLAVVGMGAIAFGIWSLIKSILYFVLVEPIFKTISSNYDDLSNSKYEAWVLVAITFALVVLFVLGQESNGGLKGRTGTGGRFLHPLLDPPADGHGRANNGRLIDRRDHSFR